jgi:hypothetical protein
MDGNEVQKRKPFMVFKNHLPFEPDKLRTAETGKILVRNTCGESVAAYYMTVP